MNHYSILVNSYDSFEDCWEPFFRLFSIFWPDYRGKVYLNTYYKGYSKEKHNVNIISTQVAILPDKRDSQSIQWSECLIRALNMIDEEIVLYMQEDYFIKDNVKVDIINGYAQLMANNPEIHCIHLTDQAVDADKPSDKFDTLWTASKNQKYRISCQAALWRKDILRSYLRPYENAWQFEYWGSKRSALLNHNFFVVDPNWCQKDVFEIIPYIFTGIIKGKWYKEVIPLFEKHQISIDYTIRGISKSQEYSIFKRIFRKIKRFPVGMRSSFGLARLRLIKLISNRI